VRIAIDMQGAQGVGPHHGIERYSFALERTMIRDQDIQLVRLNEQGAADLPIRDERESALRPRTTNLKPELAALGDATVRHLPTVTRCSVSSSVNARAK